MKYTITALTLLLTILLQAQTQKTDLAWHFGAKGDLNMSNIDGNGMANGYTSGFQLGGFAEKALGSKWIFQPELLFSQNNTKKGSDFMTYYNTDGNEFASDNIKLGYLSVPVMIKYKVYKFISLVAGPQAGIMLFDAESLVHDTKGDAFKRYEISANAGLELTRGSVSLYGRYNQGLTNINDIDDRYKWYSRHIQVGMAIKIK